MKDDQKQGSGLVTGMLIAFAVCCTSAGPIGQAAAIMLISAALA